jgi:hypothetical protein
MTIDEAIEYYIKAATQRAIADEEKGDYDKWNETRFMTKKQSTQIIADYRQLAEWLMELKEAKRLLKAVVGDLNTTVAKVYNGDIICECCKWKSQIGECCCPGDGGCDIDYRWRYIDEALKLIGEERNDIDM